MIRPGRSLPLLLLLVLCVSTTALASSTAQESDDRISPTPAQRFQQVQALRKSGGLAAALLQLDGLRTDFPHDVDYALARAQVLVDLQRIDEALPELREGMRLAPDYEDVWKLLYRLLSARDETAAVEERMALREKAAERFPDSEWWRPQRLDDDDQWRLLIGVGHDDLSNQIPSWNNQFFEIHYQQSPSRHYRLQLARNARYLSVDTTVGFGTEFSLDRDWFAGLAISSGGSADYLPEFGYSGHIGKALNAGWVVDLGYQRREFTTATVASATGTVEKYVGAFRYAYSLGLSRLDGASNFANHALTANWYYRDDASIGITVSAGDEAESLGNGQVLETNVKGFALNGHHDLNQRFGVRWWLGVSDQGEFYRRRFLGLAVSVQL